MKKFGFSLIELLVVITIVGVITAIAVPAYKRYSVSANLSKILMVLEDIANKSIQYSQSHGSFGNAQQLGLSTGDAIAVDEDVALQLVPSYMTESENPNALFQVGDFSDGYGGTPSCGLFGYVYVSIKPDALGLSPDNNAIVFIEIDYWNANGAINKVISYEYSDANQSYTDNIFPGAMNQNGATDFSYSNWTTNVQNRVLNEATCQ